MRKTIRFFLAFSILVLILAAFMAVGVGAQGSGPPTLRPTPTPVIPPRGGPGAAEPAGVPDEFPDLVVQDVVVQPATPLVNRSFLVQVTIKNQGPVDLAQGNNFYTDLYIDPGAPPESGRHGDVAWGIQSFWVPAGESHILTTTLSFTDTGTHYLYARVDTDGTVQESNEENNLFGPTQFQVQTTRRFQIITKADFQRGFSNLDLTGPEGFLQPSGLFAEPVKDPGFYTGTDQMVNDITYTLAITSVPQVVSDTVPQVKPVLVHGVTDTLYAVWEDARAGSAYNRDIYFDRSSDGGQTWSQDVRVNQDPVTNTVNQLNPQMVFAGDSPAVSPTLYVVWQDNRNGNYDIYFAKSTDGGQTWVEPAGNPINDHAVDPNAAQTNPSIAYLPGGKLFVAWQDQRNGNNDIYMAMSEDGGDTWSANEFVSDDPLTTNQSQTSPSIAVARPVVKYAPDFSCGGDTAVVVVWEDNSNSTPITSTSDIYGVYGCITSGGAITTAHADFSLDFPLGPGGMEHDPNLAVSDVPLFITHTETISVTGIPTETKDVECIALFKVKRFHTVWQHLEQGQGDIYYAGIDSPATYLGESPSQCYLDSYGIPHRLLGYDTYRDQWTHDSAPTTVNGCTHAILPSERSCTAPNAPPPAAPIQPVWRGDPAITVDEDNGDAVVTWSDARNNYDGWKRDVYVHRLAQSSSDSTDFVPESICDRVVNNNLRVYRYLNDPLGYAHYMPASANMRHPSVVAYGNRVYAAWDDDRRGDPLAGGQGNRDIFTEHSLTIGEFPHDWTYISPVFDAGGDADWFTIDWWGLTRISNTLTLQTRYGDDAAWPHDSSVTSVHWTAWTGIGGKSGVYDAPGQHLRDTSGSLFPTSRYIQFRVNLHYDPAVFINPWIYGGGANPGPCLSEVTIHYEGGAILYLPLVVKGGSGSGLGPAKVPNDPYYGTYQWNMQKIDAPQAWGTSDGSGVTIAVLDTGVDLTHPDLIAKLVSGFDFVNGDSDPSDDEGHGTHVSGIAAASTDNSVGVAGVGWAARVMPIKVLDATGNGYQSDVAAGIQWAANQGAKIINLSLGGTTGSTAVRDAINFAYSHGVLVVASSGNSYQDGNPTIYPAARDHVFAVGATTDQDQHASYSSSGSYVDISAPGGDVTGPSDTNPNHWIESTFWRGFPGGGFPAVGYMAMEGTSQAAPHVSGLAALIWAKNPALTADQVANIIESNAEDLGVAGRDDFFGYGRINAAAAVAATSSVAQAEESLASPEQQPDIGEANGQQPVEAFRPQMVLVRMKGDVSAESRQALFARYGATVRDQIPALQVWRLNVPAGQEQAVASALAAEPAVQYAELDYAVHAH